MPLHQKTMEVHHRSQGLPTGKVPREKIRHEFKYVLTPLQARLIEAYIERRHLSVDEYAGANAYPITSLYFDTPNLRDYYDKLAGLQSRRKLRARMYGDDFDARSLATVWLELKRKENMTTFKYRTPISVSDWRSFCGPGGNSFDIGAVYGVHKEKESLRRFAFLFMKGSYKPHIIVRYRRRAFEGEFASNFRLTLDSSIEACRWGERMDAVTPRQVAPGKVIMEVKFTEAMPWWFRRLLERYHLSRSVFSKYVQSVDALHRGRPLAR